MGGDSEILYASSLEGFSMDKVLETTKQIHSYRPEIPLVYLTYLNPIISYGEDKFLRNLWFRELEALFFPDLPFDSKDAKSVFQRQRILK